MGLLSDGFLPTIWEENPIDIVLGSLRRQWLRRNKPYGLETLQVRFGGLKERYRELEACLGDFLRGKIATIPELAEMPN